LEQAFKKSDVEILISTMDRQDLDFLIPMFPFSHFSYFNILIINQSLQKAALTSSYQNVRVINSLEKGLSKSRNLAITNAIHKIGVITDDDVVFVEGFDDKICKGFNRFPHAAAVKFITTTFEGIPFRKYPVKPLARLTAMQRLNSSSIEIALNIEVVKKSGLLFDERFGLGSIFPLGEEPIFINELHREGYQVCFEPEVIVTHKEIKDSDSISLAENYRIRGAYLKKIFGSIFPLWLAIQLMFNLKSGVVKPSQFFYVLKHGLQGKNQFLSLNKK
jgi:hypothetical protein